MDRPKPQPTEPFIWFGVMLFAVVLLCALAGCRTPSSAGGGSVQVSERHTDTASYPPPQPKTRVEEYTIERPAPPARVSIDAVLPTTQPATVERVRITSEFFPPGDPLVLQSSEFSRSTTQPVYQNSNLQNLTLPGINSEGAMGSSSAAFQRVEAGARANWMWVAVFGVGAVVLLFLKQWLAAIGCVALGVVATVYPVVFLIGAVLGLGYAGWLLWQRTKEAAEQKAEAQIQRKVVDQTVLGVKEAKAEIGPDAWEKLKAALAESQDRDVQRVVGRVKEKLKGVAK